MARKEKPEDLREACIQEAMAIIESSGLESLSLREVSRRLGVSHQAPYKHFPSRDHILAEIVSRAYDSFAQALDEHSSQGNPQERMEAMGRAYLDYAMGHPLQYRLMFGTPLPDPAEHPAMMQSAQHAFRLLIDCIQGLQRDPNQTELDALFAWSTMHGFATLLQTQAIDQMALPVRITTQAPDHMRLMIGRALGIPPSDSG